MRLHHFFDDQAFADPLLLGGVASCSSAKQTTDQDTLNLHTVLPGTSKAVQTCGSCSGSLRSDASARRPEGEAEPAATCATGQAVGSTEGNACSGYNVAVAPRTALHRYSSVQCYLPKERKPPNEKLGTGLSGMISRAEAKLPPTKAPRGDRFTRTRFVCQSAAGGLWLLVGERLHLYAMHESCSCFQICNTTRP